MRHVGTRNAAPAAMALSSHNNFQLGQRVPLAIVLEAAQQLPAAAESRSYVVMEEVKEDFLLNLG